MVDRDFEFSFFHSVHVRIDIKIDISISIRPIITKFGTSTAFESNETNQAGAGAVITLRLRDKLKRLYLDYQSAYDYQT